MTKYQLLKKEDRVMWQFIKKGIISYQILRDIQIVEQFEALEPLSNEARYEVLASDFELSSRRIKQIIQSMTS